MIKGVVMINANEVIELLTEKDVDEGGLGSFDKKQLDDLLALADRGLDELFSIQKKILDQ